MQKNSITVVLAFLVVLACPYALADGLIYKGHVNGPCTLLTLTKEQISSLAHGKDKITLTESQRKRLEGLKNVAKVKELEVLPVTTETCTCELLNVAVRINKGSIEQANDLFGRDRAKEYNDFLLSTRRREEQQKAEQAKPSYILRSVEERFRKLSDRVGRQLKPVEQESH
jgi:hypothetical protein